MMRWLVVTLLLLCPCLAPAATPEPLLSSRFADIAYSDQDSFLKDLLRRRDPRHLQAPGASYKAPVVSAINWQGKEGVVLTQRAWFLGEPYHLVVFIVASDYKPLYKTRRVHIECRLEGNLSRRDAIERCRRQQGHDD
ncbi:hypothetical protein PVT67_18155 [Gallaecimonas kandeliae]|uniref:hypothetical protein n=1 Tax=Gallaecimonas kandeliae TaxID=3029055 RepID=UPI002648AB58|nr:hypothetical protein [Gallaecimonas kandeliae]WKE65563.1 hypothetical protein PVT67_18155 [Gallaecimonas kandeliae]